MTFDDIMKKLDGQLFMMGPGSPLRDDQLGSVAEQAIALALRALLAHRERESLDKLAQRILDTDGRHEGWQSALRSVVPLKDGSGFILELAHDPDSRAIGFYFGRGYHETWKRAGWTLRYYAPNAIFGKTPEKCSPHVLVGEMRDYHDEKKIIGVVPLCKYCGTEVVEA